MMQPNLSQVQSEKKYCNGYSVGEMNSQESGWTEAQRFAIIEELKSILKDPSFNRSKRCMSLLHWLVERSLANDTDGLKERTVGMAVFGRSADYDTNNDSVVRMAANEVRKRLAMYYQSPEAKCSLVRIRLVPHSYVPEFDFLNPESFSEFPAESETLGSNYEDFSRSSATERAHEAHITGEPTEFKNSVYAPIDKRSDNPSQVEGETARNEAPQTKENSVRQFLPLLLVFFAGVLLTSLVVVFSNTHVTLNRSSQYMAWEPLLKEKTPPIICLSAAEQITPTGAGINSAVDQTGSAALYSFEDLIVANKVSLWMVDSGIRLVNHGTHVALRKRCDISLLDHQPIVLIGAADGLWPSTLLSSLRFTPRTDPATGMATIYDTQRQSKTNFVQSGSNGYDSTVDYAIVTRYMDKQTGNWIFSIDGLGQHGTEAAGQLMVDPYFANAIPKDVRTKKNFQMVVKTIAVNGKTGTPQIVDFYAW